jgi:hypothetical protein
VEERLKIMLQNYVLFCAIHCIIFYSWYYFLFLVLFSILGIIFYSLYYFRFMVLFSIHGIIFYSLYYFLFLVLFSIHCIIFYSWYYFLFMVLFSIHGIIFYSLYYFLFMVLFSIYGIIFYSLYYFLFLVLFSSSLPPPPRYNLVSYSSYKYLYIFSRFLCDVSQCQCSFGNRFRNNCYSLLFLKLYFVVIFLLIVLFHFPLPPPPPPLPQRWLSGAEEHELRLADAQVSAVEVISSQRFHFTALSHTS